MMVDFFPHLRDVVKMMANFTFKYFGIRKKDTFSFNFIKLTFFKQPLQKTLLMNIT